MADSKDNRIPVKLNPDVKAALDAMQYEIRVSEGKKPTHSDVIMRALAALRTSDGTEAKREFRPADERSLANRRNEPWHARLDIVLGDPEEASFIQKSLEMTEQRVAEKRKRPAGRLANGE